MRAITGEIGSEAMVEDSSAGEPFEMGRMELSGR